MGLLSWLRGGRGDAAPAAPGSPAASPTPPEPSAPTSRESRFGMSELPPIQRTLGAPSLLTDPSGFEGGLPTRRPTALTSALGHLVSAGAPSGVVGGVAAPVRRSVIDFPVRTLPTASLQETATGAEPVSGPDPGPLPVSATGPVTELISGAGLGPGTPGTTAVPDIAPPAVPLAATPANSRSKGPAAVHPVQRAAEAPVVPEPAPTPMPVRAESPEPPPAEPEPESGIEVRPLVGDRPALDTPDAPDTPVSTPPRPAVQRSLPQAGPPGAARRTPGLGAPLPGLPPTAQREAPAAVRPPSATPMSPAAAAPAPAPAPAPAELPPPIPEPTPGAISGPAPEATSEPEPVAPLLADRPLHLRAVAEEHTAAPVPPAPAVQAVRWEQAAIQRPVPAPVRAGPAAPVRWSVAEPPGGRPTPRASRSARAPRDAGDVAVAAGIAQRMADGSVVFLPPPPVRRAAPLPTAPFVQRETVTEEPPPPDPEPATATTTDTGPGSVPAEPGPEPEAAVPPPGAAAASTSHPVAAPPGTPAVTDEFVRALYPPLARLLKADLRLDRERAGRLLDKRF